MPDVRPLEGIKIADFTWMGQGPLATKMLGDWGATVVKIESRVRLDQHRAMVPMIGGIPGVNRCAVFFRYNSSKYSITLNLKHPKGLYIAKKLIAWCDVVTENFIPGTLDKWNLGYEELKKIKPDIIMVRASMQGQEGYYARHPGLGTMIMAQSGYADLVGWPDRMPVGISAQITDFIGAAYFKIAILGALDYRRRTGRGQCLDMAQLEAGLTLLSPNVLDYSINKRLKKRTGNRHPTTAPHGVYPCKGEDQWCCIEVFTDDDWKSLCLAMGRQDLSHDPRFGITLDRKKNEDELDELIGQWTKEHTAEDVMLKLQGVGVAAGMVKNASDIYDDPQLRYRKHFQTVEQGEVGPWEHETCSFRMANRSSELRPAPCLGEHNEYIYTKLLGIPDAEFIQLLSEGVFE